MKLKVHESTALALSYLLWLWTVPHPPLQATLYGALTAVFSQRLLDELGHDIVCKRGRCYPVRNKLHSLPAVAAIGLLLSLPVYAMGAGLPYAAAPLVVLLLHLAEDIVTEGGVYVGEGRVRLIGVRYDDPAVNASASLAFTAALLLNPPPADSVAWLYWLASLSYLVYSLR